jgi:hypothetical protein
MILSLLIPHCSTQNNIQSSREWEIFGWNTFPSFSPHYNSILLTYEWKMAHNLFYIYLISYFKNKRIILYLLALHLLWFLWNTSSPICGNIKTWCNFFLKGQLSLECSVFKLYKKLYCYNAIKPSIIIIEENLKYQTMKLRNKP